MTTDVLVVGAGAAGCATALTLRKRGVECAVIEKMPGSPHRFCGEFLSGEASLRRHHQNFLSPTCYEIGLCLPIGS